MPRARNTGKRLIKKNGTKRFKKIVKNMDVDCLRLRMQRMNKILNETANMISLLGLCFLIAGVLRIMFEIGDILVTMIITLIALIFWAISLIFRAMAGIIKVISEENNES